MNRVFAAIALTLALGIPGSVAYGRPGSRASIDAPCLIDAFNRTLSNEQEGRAWLDRETYDDVELIEKLLHPLSAAKLPFVRARSVGLVQSSARSKLKRIGAEVDEVPWLKDGWFHKLRPAVVDDMDQGMIQGEPEIRKLARFFVVKALPAE